MAPVAPAVLGAADEELAQLVRPEQAGKPGWQHALSESELLDAAFERLTASARDEREAVAQKKVRDTTFKQNRRETYLNPRVHRRWMERARQFLRRRSKELSEASLSTLYSMVVLHHLLELDAEDAKLPMEQRRFEDGCTDGVSDQFLLDAARGRYTVEDELFHYAETPDDEVQKDFIERLLVAVREVAPPPLTTHVTALMSQSAMAALERATLCTAVMCGGSQEVSYSLRRDPATPEGVLVTMQVHRHGFREYLCEADIDDGPKQSDQGSSLLKSATIALDPAGAIDVVELVEDINIMEDGQPVSLDVLCKPIIKAPKPRTPRARWQLQRALLCLQGCFRRCNRSARRPELQAGGSAAD